MLAPRHARYALGLAVARLGCFPMGRNHPQRGGYGVLLNAQLIHRVFTQCLARTLPSECFAFSSPARVLASRHNVNPVWTALRMFSEGYSYRFGLEKCAKKGNVRANRG